MSTKSVSLEELVKRRWNGNSVNQVRQFGSRKGRRNLRGRILRQGGTTKVINVSIRIPFMFVEPRIIPKLQCTKDTFELQCFLDGLCNHASPQIMMLM